VKSSKAQIHAKSHKIPETKFEDQRLTSFSGLLVFQLLFKRIRLKQRLKKCFSSLKRSPILGHYLIVMLLVVHLLLVSEGRGRLITMAMPLGSQIDGVEEVARRTHARGCKPCQRAAHII